MRFIRYRGEAFVLSTDVAKYLRLMADTECQDVAMRLRQAATNFDSSQNGPEVSR